MAKKLLERTMEKNYKKQIKVKFRTKKLIKEKGDKLHVKWKSLMIPSLARQIQKTV